MNTAKRILLILALLAIPPLPEALAAARPDLVVTRLSPSLSSQEAGGRLLLDFSLENTGTAAAKNFYVRFYYTTGEMPGPGEAPLTDKFVLSLAPGERLDAKAAVRLPAGLASGPGRFVAVADDANAVLELNEANNVATAPFSVGARQASPALAQGSSAYPSQIQGQASPQSQGQVASPPSEQAPANPEERYYGKPGSGAASAPASAPAGQNAGRGAGNGSGKANLVVTSASIADGPFLPGQDMLVDFEIRNTGGQPAEHFFVAFCLLDGKSTASPSTCPDRQMIQSLAPNTSKGDRGSMLLPFTLAPGQHKLGVIVDFDDKVAESNETDNALSVGFTSLPAPKTEDF
ncbi:MAG: CARDB domain-containing protein [Desulfovibrio sp.]